MIDGEVWCEYPFIKDPACLPYNRATVVKVAERVEKDLMKDGLHAAYNEQIKSQLERGVAIKLSADEYSHGQVLANTLPTTRCSKIL